MYVVGIYHICLSEAILMCNFYSLIMVFPGYLLFHLVEGKLFSLQSMVLCPKMCCKNFEKIG